MRMIVLSAVLALGLGLAGATGTSAETVGANINSTAGTSTTIDMSAQWHHRRRSHMRCWIVRRCWHVRFSRRHCRPHRVCRHW